ncbi:undecaprenyl-phosphate glucose phosphotransferase [Sphingobium sp. AR-3-1]|uniref:Undecaprenyl-phosphate glucose phosphotransferase n=1 Tax=Sphingobium psychrophilum TaxID=2728834 RepID=A0A7X9WT34_9SPHN|nr:undecaprenyl-phosphate glucose phosphotransferase [Sphingobium psychrophilum]NML09421.1 undecaprenyl-phosphate glucose phosphotransferase [Sphingobium psychrophilum]
MFQQFGALFVRLCRLVDTALILLCMALVAGALSPRSAIIDTLLCVAVLELVASFFHLSRSWRIVRLRHELADLTAHWTISFAGIMTLFWLLGDLPLAHATLWAPTAALWYGASLGAIILFRIVVRLALRFWRSFGYDHRSAAFIGATETAQRLGDVFARQRWMGIRSMGVFDDRRPSDDRTVALPDQAFGGPVDRLYDLARSGAVSRIYVTLPMAAEQRIKAILDRFGDTTASLYYCPPLFRLDLVGARWDDVYGQPVVSIVESPFEGYSRLVKRAEDVALTLIALPVILPICLLAGVAIKLDTRGPIFFSQTRYGLDGRPFRIWKFRSMRVADDSGFIQARRGDSRVTRVGALLRRTSIDELPQFINVALGSMSVVGPRPHPVALDDNFRPLIHRYAVRHKIKPGITGLAQVSGWRGETDTRDKMEQRVVHDIEYLRRWSIWLDLQIVARTLLVPFVQRNAF